MAPLLSLITNNDERGGEVPDQVVRWYQDNYLSLNINKTNEMIVNYRRLQASISLHQ